MDPSVMILGAGFYKAEGDTLLYGPQSVFGPAFTLERALKDTYTYPVDGWTWFDSPADAVVALNVPMQDTDVYADNNDADFIYPNFISQLTLVERRAIRDAIMSRPAEKTWYEDMLTSEAPHPSSLLIAACFGLVRANLITEYRALALLSLADASFELASSAELWFDPSDDATLFQEHTGSAATTPAGIGDPVGTWVNKGTLGGYLTAAASDATRPIRAIDASEAPVLTFASADLQTLNGDASIRAFAQNQGVVTIGVGFSTFSDIPCSMAFFTIGTSASGRVYLQLDANGKWLAGGRRLDSDSNQTAAFNGKPVLNAIYSMAGQWDFEKADLKLYVNNSVLNTKHPFQTAGVTSNTASQQFIFGSYVSGLQHCNGNLGSFIGLRRKLTPSELVTLDETLRGVSSYQKSGWAGDQPANTSDPNAPKDLVSVAISDTSCAFSWTYPTVNPDPTFIIRRNGEQIGTTQNVCYRDTGLAADTLYTYTVEAQDSGYGESRGYKITTNYIEEYYDVFTTRAFSSTSSWNKLLSDYAGHTLDDVVWRYPAPGLYWVNYGAYSYPYYNTNRHDPLVSITIPSNWGRPSTTLYLNLAANKEGAGGTDKAAIIFDHVTKNLYSIYNFKRTGANSATATAYGVANPVTGTGWGTGSQNSGTNAGTTAIGHNGQAGLITQRDLDAGVIDHALALLAYQYDAGPGFVGEALHGDGYRDIIQGPEIEGMRFALDPDEPLPGAVTSTLGQMIFTALKNYGAYVTDKSGSTVLLAQQNAFHYNSVITHLQSNEIGLIITLLKRVNLDTFPCAFDSTARHVGISVGISLSNLLAPTAGTTGSAQNIRSISKYSTGKKYCEMALTTGTSSKIGFCDATFVMGTDSLGAGNTSVCLQATDGLVKLNGATVLNFDGALSAGQVVDMALDLDNSRAWWRINGGNWNNSPTADPETNTEGLDVSALGSSLYVAVEIDTTTHTVTGNFGATAYSYAAPSGFINWLM